MKHDVIPRAEHDTNETERDIEELSCQNLWYLVLFRQPCLTIRGFECQLLRPNSISASEGHDNDLGLDIETNVKAGGDTPDPAIGIKDRYVSWHLITRGADRWKVEYQK